MSVTSRIATLGQAAKILEMITGKSMKADEVQRLLISGLLSDLFHAATNPDALQEVDRGLFQRLLEPKLESLFISPEEQIERLKSWNKWRGWGFTEDQIDSAEFALGRSENEPDGLTVWVLNISLESVVKTFWEAFLVAKDAQRNRDYSVWVDDYIRNSEPEILLMDGVDFKPQTLTWQRIDLGANRGISTEYVRSRTDPTLLPSSGILWAAAYFPKWARAIEEEHPTKSVRIPSIRIPGYLVGAERYQGSAFGMSWCRKEGRIEIHVSDTAERTGRQTYPYPNSIGTPVIVS